MNFDWQTDEEGSQSDDAPSGKRPASTARKRGGLAILRQAAARADLELFSATLSGRDPHWMVIQKELLEQEALFDRSFSTRRCWIGS